LHPYGVGDEKFKTKALFSTDGGKCTIDGGGKD
jgi:hypothetical protein